ncbi:hypothetical protein [Neisseria perflava]|uniref:hypothetical protein n=1 Tax=Neisseria perflava TaxID=33053 RepID=UPI00209CC1DC|nr:hypothetical protein [Neisseria perflava]MCP1659139.1 hypothetical protein [Neisseria perflava]MCP1771364.1 hypothetical protein [Neisseria perflava]
MQIHKTLAEITAMLEKQSGKTVALTQTAPDNIRARYLVNIDLTLTGHGDDTLQFSYALGWGASLLAKSAAGIFGDIRTKKLSLDTRAQTLQINLAVFGEFKSVLKTHRITAAQIADNALMVELAPKS